MEGSRGNWGTEDNDKRGEEKSSIKGIILKIKEGGAGSTGRGSEVGMTQKFRRLHRAWDWLFCFNSERGTGILSLATGHWESAALQAESAVPNGLPQRKTTNELNSVESRHAGVPELLILFPPELKVSS